VRLARFSFLLLAILGMVAVAGATTSWQWLQKGDELYNHRADGANGDQGNIAQAQNIVQAYRQAMSDVRIEKLVASRLLKAWYFQGCFAYVDQKDRLRIFTEARNVGAAMVAKYPGDPELSYWYSVHLSLWAKESGPWAAIRSGVADKIRLVSERALQAKSVSTPQATNPTLAGVYQILGRMNHLLPRIPFILSWPDKQMAEFYLRTAVRLDPANPANALFLAEYYRDMGRYSDAERAITPLLNSEPRTVQILEDRRNLWKLRELDVALKPFTEPQRLAMAPVK